METPKQSQLAKAIIEVMKAVNGIEKNKTVGEGNMQYKGVADQDVKNVLKVEMEKNGLCILPLTVKPTTHISRWEEKNGTYIKQKQSVFTEVETTYKLLHVSGEFEILSGYGHGVDSQDKSCGKATTYALKYLLLYLFMVPTGAIDDTDNTHSENIEKAPQTTKQESDSRPWLSDQALEKVIQRIKTGEEGVYDKTVVAFRISKEKMTKIEEAINGK